MDDKGYKSENERQKEKEIDDFLNRFDRPDSTRQEDVIDRFDQITSTLDRGPRGKEAANASSHSPSEPKNQEIVKSQNPSLPSESRLSRLQNERENKRNRSRRSSTETNEMQQYGDEEKFSLTETSLTAWATVCAWFSGLFGKDKTGDPSENAESNKTGATMTGKRNRKKHYKINGKKMFKFIISIGFALCVIAGIMVGVIIATTPPIDTENIILSENSVMYDDEGKILDSIYKGDSGLRTNVEYDDLPQDLVDAFVSIEDKTFWKHHGFNFVRIFGAVFESVTKGESISGTSTITQQLARNLYLTDRMTERSLTRKIQEAWYSIQLESHLTKKEIIAAYLNTINLGYRANGVQAASQAYFSKDVGELTLPECTLLATLPKSPGAYSPVKGDANENLTSVDLDSLDIISRTDDWTTWYNDRSVSSGRYQLVLQFMLEQEKISQAEYDQALAYKIRDSINPGDNVTDNDISSYMADYVINQVVDDLVKQTGVTKDEAKNSLYNGGLRIYSTMNMNMQQAAENVFDDSSNFPGVANLNKDKSGNVLDKNGRVMLYSRANYLTEDGSFVLSAEEYKKNTDGSMTIYKGKRLNIYTVESKGEEDYNLELKPMYELIEKAFYSRSRGVIQIPQGYKSRDAEGNLVVSAKFFQDKPDFFLDNGTSMTVSASHMTLEQNTRQPQAAMVIMDQKTGSIKAMVGGRNTEGRQLLNRTTSPRQPGSSIKPMGVYAPALQSGAKGETDWTAASMIDDAPMTFNGKVWPKNWYSGYQGLYTLRQSVEQSVNVNAVKVFQDIGVQRSVDSLKSFGVSSIVEEGSTNDLNAAALALGGMTYGISPLEMCAGYSVFANDGVYIEPTCYTKVTNKYGDVLLESDPESHRVIDEGVAFITRDILRTTVSNGIAKAANVGTHITAGKTGTTTDQYDAWFVGFTPLYTASLWIGNDVNIELSQGSAAATKVWSKVMKEIHKNLPKGSFSPAPSTVVTATIDTKSGKLASELSALDSRGNTTRSEYFIKGTVPKETDDIHIKYEACSASGFLATPWCPVKETRVGIDPAKRAGTDTADSEYNAPSYYCNLHNLDTTTYPVKPGTTVDSDFTPPEEGETGGEGEGGTGTDTPEGGGSTNPPPPSGGGSTDSDIPDWLNTN